MGNAVDLSDTELSALQVVVVCMCSLSMLGSGLMILSYRLWKDIRVASRKILCFLSLADFGVACSAFLGVIFEKENLLVADDGGSTRLCVATSFVTTYCSICSFCWTTCMAIFLYISIVKGNPKGAERAMRTFHVVCWGFPLVVLCVALGFDVLGYDSSVAVGWCWLKHKGPFPLWQLMAGKLWEMLSYVLTTYFYIAVKRKISQEMNNPPRGSARNSNSNDGVMTDDMSSLVSQSALQAAKEADRKMVLVPVVFVLVRLWGTIRYFVTNYSADSDNLYWLAVLQGLGDTSQGFVNAILFCFFTKAVRAHILACCRRKKLPPFQTNMPYPAYGAIRSLS
eukprot:m.309443 g.309443  ORF g.309443 m.309443 type:complete len:339 (-) comp23034_c7_seq4:236-1252(-)